MNSSPKSSVGERETVAPFKAQCNETKRKGFTRQKWNKKKNKMLTHETRPIICEEQIWFEPSLKDGVFVGRCSVESHNPVYRIIP